MVAGVSGGGWILANQTSKNREKRGNAHISRIIEHYKNTNPSSRGGSGARFYFLLLKRNKPNDFNKRNYFFILFQYTCLSGIVSAYTLSDTHTHMHIFRQNIKYNSTKKDEKSLKEKKFCKEDFSFHRKPYNRPPTFFLKAYITHSNYFPRCYQVLSSSLFWFCL